MPLNIEDEDMSSSTEGLPLSFPTAISYTLCRVRLAVVSRQIADETADQLFQGIETPYEKIIELDRKLHDSLNEIPEFYRFGSAAQQRFATLYHERPVFASQRSMLHVAYTANTSFEEPKTRNTPTPTSSVSDQRAPCLRSSASWTKSRQS